MNNNIHKITSKQLMVFVISSQTGLGVLLLPSILAKNTGHDGWISVILGGILSTVALIIILVLLKRYSDKSILDINQLLYGKYLGKLINFIFILYLYLGAVLGLRLFGEIITLTILKLTPPLILTFFIFTPTIYMTWNGLKVIARFSNIILVTILWVLLYLFLIYKNVKIVFLLPIGEAGIDQIFRSAFPTFIAYLGIELTTIVYPYITDKEKTMKYALTGNVITTIFYTLIVFFTTGVFGEHMLKKLILPIFVLSAIYKAPVLERLDLFFVALWFPVMACSLRAYLFSTYHCISKVLNIKSKLAFFIPFILVTIFLSRVPKDFAETLGFVNIFNTSGISIIIFLIICTIFSFINKRGVKKQ